VPFEPSDVKGLKEAMARWIVDEAAIAKARAAIAAAQDAPRPTWSDAGEVLLKHALG
jgi:hypothetical protein